MKYYKVEEEDLRCFIKYTAKLEALEAGGVDNWSWYGESCSDYLEDMKEMYGIPQEEDFDFDDIAKHEIQKFRRV